MAKVNNPETLSEVQKLKQEADAKGLSYKKNASVAQMKELLANADVTGEQSEVKNEAAQQPEVEQPPVEKQPEVEQPRVDQPNVEEQVDVAALLAKINNLEELVRKTGDHNKIKEFEDAQKGMEGFSFVLKLFPMDDTYYPIVRWKTLTNYVARSDSDKTDQRIVITYVKEGEEIDQEIQLVDFARVLERSEPILATSLNNLDNSEVYVEEKISEEEDAPFYVIRPKGNTFNVTLSYKGQKLTILSTYLNA